MAFSGSTPIANFIFRNRSSSAAAVIMPSFNRQAEALKKVVKVASIIVGLFLAGLAYLQYQHIVAINWNKVPQLSQNIVTTLANATTQIPGFNSGHTADISISNFGIPLTGSISVGFTIGFMRG
jgi:uncharacterized membrane protein (Fun14 family)